MPRMNLAEWLEKFVKETAQEVVKEQLGKYQKAGVAAMREMRDEVNDRFGSWGPLLKSAQVIKANSIPHQNANGMQVRITSYVETTAINSANVAAAESWMAYHKEHFNLNDPYTGQEYVVEKLFMDQGILGLPKVGTWQNEGGLHASNPQDNKYLRWRRKNPWVNPHFEQVTPIEQVLDGEENAARFIQLLESKL